jgi:tRNA threonylcarbamoyladenosine biosynthesis protein TsaB
LPSLDWLLGRCGYSKGDIESVVVCTGPGSYAGLRVGLSTAKALAFSLDASLAGVGRLQADAEPLARERGGRVVAVHAAGRAELAWAAYTRAGGRLSEVAPPLLGPLDRLLDVLQPGDTVCSELRTLDGSAADALARAAELVEAPASRILAIARLGRQRLESGDSDSADALVPLYLRAPAIGPQR